MRLKFLITSLVLLLIVLGSKTAFSQISVSVVQEQKFSPTALTTEMIWSIDPDLPNPARARWAIERKIFLKGLSAPIKKEGTRYFQLDSFQIEASSTIFLRHQNLPKWYNTMNEFPCHSMGEIHPRFATFEGTRRIALEASELWLKDVNSAKFRLELRLKSIQGVLPEQVLEKAQITFELWEKELTATWREKVETDLSKKEWAYYHSEAKKNEVCINGKGKPKNKPIALPSWEEILEIPPTQTQENTHSSQAIDKTSHSVMNVFSYPAKWLGFLEDRPSKMLSINENEKEKPVGNLSLDPLSRIPLRIAGGLFSMKVGIEAAGRNLVGRFIVDPAFSHTVMSPELIDKQGIRFGLIEEVGASFQKILWGNGAIQGLSKKVKVADVTAAGYSLKQRQLHVISTQVFQSPEFISSCCDGILGFDTLSRLVLNFSPNKVPKNLQEYSLSLTLFAPTSDTFEKLQNFRAEYGIGSVFWEKGQLISECENNMKVRWDFSQNSPIQIISKGKGRKPLRCFGVELYPGYLAEDGGFLSIGTPVLMRAPFILDLPNGRIYLSKKFETEAVIKNDSGLELQFVYNSDGNRVLKVKSIAPKSSASMLEKLGLKIGQNITQIDTLEVDQLDAWEVEQRLGGRYGKVVTLQWKIMGSSSKQAYKVVPLPLD